MSEFTTLYERDLNNPTRPPLCIDCAYVGGKTFAEPEKMGCFHVNNYAGINLVDGSKLFKERLCINHRNIHADNLCGVTGKWFKLYEKPAPILVEKSFSNEAIADIREAAKKRVEAINSGKRISKDKLDNL